MSRPETRDELVRRYYVAQRESGTQWRPVNHDVLTSLAEQMRAEGYDID